MDLTIVWAFIIAFAVAAYVVMDGFDLGIGIIFPALRVGAERDQAVNAVAPVWDGNETWLVMGGGGLLAAFPLAYAIVLPALYAPLIAMLLGLIFRGVAFEFRWRDAGHRRWWDGSFFLGSLVATLAQGITLGALLQGIAVEGRAYAGGWWDWLTPFSLLTAAALVVGYGLLGACWLVWKTEGELQAQARGLARWLAVLTLAGIVAVSLIMPFLLPAFRARWFDFPLILTALPVPVLVVFLAWRLFRSLAEADGSVRHDVLPFLCALGLFFLSYTGLGISMWPMIVPPEITIWEAAAPRDSQLFLLVGAAVLIPVVLAYTGYVYWLFRGKVKAGQGYH